MKCNCLHLVALLVLVLFLAACSPATQPQPALAPTQPPPTAAPPTPLPPTEPPARVPSAPTATASAASEPTSVIAVSSPITETVQLGDITMYYASYGEGEPLLLLHGGSGSSDDFAKQVPAFSEKYRVITPDSRGQGRTTDSDAPPSYHLMAEDMVRLMDYLKVDKAYIVGWSDGGNIGLDVAINHPERVRALVTFGANMSPDGIQPGPLAFFRSASTESLQQALGGEYRRLSSTPEHLPVLVEKLRKMWLTEPTFTADQLASIKSPTAIVDGKREQFVSTEHVEAIAKVIPNANLDTAGRSPRPFGQARRVQQDRAGFPEGQVIASSAETVVDMRAQARQPALELPDGGRPPDHANGDYPWPTARSREPACSASAGRG